MSNDREMQRLEGERLNQLLRDHEVGRDRLAELMNTSRSVVDNWCIGRTKMTREIKHGIAQVLNVPDSDLKIVKANRESSATLKRGAIPAIATGNLRGSIPVARTGYRMVPIYGALSAGTMAYSYSDVVDFEEMPEWGGDFNRWGRVVAGNSMHLPEDEGFEDGDVVIFEDRRHENGNAVHAIREGEDVFKIYQRTTEGEVLVPLNDSYPALPIQDYQIVGVAVGRIRQHRHYKDTRIFKGGFRQR